MIALWTVLGCLFILGLGMRFGYRVLGLTPAEAAAVFVIIAMLVGINTGPGLKLLMEIL